MLSSLVRSSSAAKAIARSIVPSAIPSSGPQATSGGEFFVPADGGAPPGASSAPKDAEEDETQTLLQTLAEHLSLALLARSHQSAAHAESEDPQRAREEREWDRVVVGYLALLAQWLWADPRGVREFLEAGGASTLVEPIAQTGGADILVQGLCALVLGCATSSTPSPGRSRGACCASRVAGADAGRATLHPIVSRVGADTIVSRMARMREDDRFRAISPDGGVLPYPVYSHSGAVLATEADQLEAEAWFDWEFVEFWKSNYYTVQRGVGMEPHETRPSTATAAPNPEATTLIASLREVIQKQADDIEALNKQLIETRKTRDEERDALQTQISALSAELETVQEKRKETEKEHEDLLVFLEELSAKRKREKGKLRELGQEVSDDEDAEEEE